jgi:8-oxo-dGTP pyrophosphatase MutT (NUDIX family)
LKTSDLFTEESLIEFFRSYQRTEIIDAGLHRAAVLIPLVVHDSSVGVLFTVRTEDVEHHKGQISFPGGVKDPEDLSLIQTALRETNEEIGINSSFIQILGVCGDLSTPSGFNIAPVVGYIPILPPLRLQAQEVAEVLIIPLSFFLDPSNRRISTETHNGHQRRIVRYTYNMYGIWGATAAMLARFLAEVVGEPWVDS